MRYLSVAEFARYSGYSERHVRRLIANNSLAAICAKENGKTIYHISVISLPAKKQRQYYKSHNIPLPENLQPKKKESRDYESLSDMQRQQVSQWIEILSDWKEFCARFSGGKTDANQAFLEQACYDGVKLSVDILYRKQRRYEAGDLAGLVDMRGTCRKGKSGIPQAAWDTFMYYYLDQVQHPLKKCYLYTEIAVRKEQPELLPLPAYTTFYRRLQRDVPEAIKVLGRCGEQAFDDRCAPYIRRTYKDMHSNDWWVADNHTFDVMTGGRDNKPHRLYLTAFFDARSGIFVGCYVTDAPSSQATLIALRKGILKYGIPQNIYVDNGREFLTFDIGGLGHRQKKSTQDQFNPPPVFQRLGIKMTNAIVRNAKAKIIERRFRDVKDHVSRLFQTYTGGNVIERPEQLKQVLKSGKIPSDADFAQMVEKLLDHYINQQPYGGSVARDKGKPRMQIYTENLIEKRVASETDLNLMLMRSSRAQKVTRRGVHLDICGERLDYWSDELLINYLGEQVYYRYDPDNLSSVRIYDLQDRYIMSCPVDSATVLTYGASQEDVKTAVGKVKQMRKITKQAIKASTLTALGKRTALELVLEEAEENMQAQQYNTDPKIISIQRADEHLQHITQRAVGSEEDIQPVKIDKARMIRNAESRGDD